MIRAMSMDQLLKDTWEYLDRPQSSSDLITRAATGLTELDALTGGLHPSELVVVAGRPSMGKTALLLNILRHTALELSTPVLLHCLDIDAQCLCRNILGAEARVDAIKLRTGVFTESDRIAMVRASERLREAQIFIDDTSALSIAELSSRLRSMKIDLNLGLCLVDSLQLMRASPPGGSRSRSEELAEVVWTLQSLARELSLPVVASSSLNRRPEHRRDNRPILSDLRDCGEIEEAASTVILLHRPEYYDSDDCPGMAELIVAKQRNGPTDTAQVAFVAEQLRYDNVSFAPGTEADSVED